MFFFIWFHKLFKSNQIHLKSNCNDFLENGVNLFYLCQFFRCGTHSDYGTLTLLYQDGLGGLEVKAIDQTWIEAKPIPGTILVSRLLLNFLNDKNLSQITLKFQSCLQIFIFSFANLNQLLTNKKKPECFYHVKFF